MNWVDKRFTREQNLTKGAAGVWQAISTALDNACQSLQEHYADLNSIDFKPQNGHRALINITRNRVPADVENFHRAISIQVIFEPFESHISVVVGYNRNPQNFAIKSDETHAFVVHNGKEISPDELSRVILEDVFFKVQDLSTSRQHSVGGDSAWMR